MLAATQAWKIANPQARLQFAPLGCPPDTAVIGGLTRQLIRKVGANAKTRELLRVMDTAICNQGTVLQAEMCLKEVWGLERAISGTGIIETSQTPPTVCPGCGKVLSAATARNAVPKPGDFSVCVYCTAVLRFNPDLTLRTTTLEERKEMDPEQGLAIFEVVNRLQLGMKGKHE